jgi:hypothetical protein
MRHSDLALLNGVMIPCLAIDSSICTAFNPGGQS